MKKAWYLGHREDQVAERAILIGDPDRVDRIAAMLEAPEFLPVSRGLKTVTGTFEGAGVTAVAFGMGAPIATIVLHELADLGVRRFVRIGTAMYFPPAGSGDFLVSDTAIGFEGTSPAYADTEGPVSADPELAKQLVDAAATYGKTVLHGQYATFDAFYRDMFGIDEEGKRRVGVNRAMLAERGVLATDMETSALLTAARVLGVSCASLCLGTVDALTQVKLDRDLLAEGERILFEIALQAITSDR